MSSSADRRQRRLLAMLALAEHAGTPTAEARTALDGVDQVIAAADGDLDRYRLRAACASGIVPIRALAHAFPEPTRP